MKQCVHNLFVIFPLILQTWPAAVKQQSSQTLSHMICSALLKPVWRRKTASRTYWPVRRRASAAQFFSTSERLSRDAQGRGPAVASTSRTSETEEQLQPRSFLISTASLTAALCTSFFKRAHWPTRQLCSRKRRRSRNATLSSSFSVSGQAAPPPKRWGIFILYFIDASVAKQYYNAI